METYEGFMAELDQEAAPAGAETMDIAAAAALLTERDEKQPAAETVETAQETPAAEEAPAETVAQTEETEPAREAAPEEPEAHDLDKIHGNTKIRLRDGTEWSAAELKRRIADLQEIDKHRETFQQESTRFLAERSQIQQQAQLFAQIAPQAIAAIQASLPKVPPLPAQSLAQTDPFKYSEELSAHLEAKQEYESKVNQARQIQNAAYQQQVQAQQEQASRMVNAVKQERNKLLEKFPEFSDSGKAREFQSDFMKYGKSYGFSEQEIGAVFDHRMIGVVRDAIAYQKLKANPPKPAAPKSAQTAPLQQAGARPSHSESNAQRRQQLIQKVKKSGDMREIADAMTELNM